MASYSTFGIDELAKAFDYESTVPEEVKNIMLKQMGDVLLEATKQEGRNRGVYDPNSSTHVLDNMKLSKPIIKANYAEISVTFRGTRTDKKHKTKIRNAEIAFLNEFGVPKRGIDPIPFMYDAIQKNADKINEAGAKILFTYLDKNNN